MKHASYHLHLVYSWDAVDDVGEKVVGGMAGGLGPHIEEIERVLRVEQVALGVENLETANSLPTMRSRSLTIDNEVSRYDDALRAVAVV